MSDDYNYQSQQPYSGQQPNTPQNPSGGQVPPVPPQSTYEHRNTARIPVSPQVSRHDGRRPPSKRSIFVIALVAVLLGLLVGGLIVGIVTKNNSKTTTSTTAVSSNSNGTITINASEESSTLAEAVSAKVLPSVVSIDVYSSSGSSSSFSMSSSDTSSGETYSGLGSGIILTSDGYILTNYHVVEDSSSLIVKIDDNSFSASIVGTDSSSDLAVVKIDASGLTPIEIGSSENLVVGQWVMAAGSPYGLEKSVSTGIISALYRSTSMQSSTGLSIYANMIQTDAAVNPGNSGGALVDSSGKLIGINTLIESSSGSNSGVAFAIPVDYAMKIADQLEHGEQVQHAYLGVSLASVTSQNYKSANLSVQSGAYISQVESGSPASSAGLQKGDVITKVNGTSVTSASEAIIQIRSYSPDDKISIEYVRGTDTKTTDVTLSGATDSSSGYNNSSSSSSSSQNTYGNGGSSSGSSSSRSSSSSSLFGSDYGDAEMASDLTDVIAA